MFYTVKEIESLIVDMGYPKLPLVVILSSALYRGVPSKPMTEGTFELIAESISRDIKSDFLTLVSIWHNPNLLADLQMVHSFVEGDGETLTVNAYFRTLAVDTDGEYAVDFVSRLAKAIDEKVGIGNTRGFVMAGLAYIKNVPEKGGDLNG